MPSSHPFHIAGSVVKHWAAEARLLVGRMLWIVGNCTRDDYDCWLHGNTHRNRILLHGGHQSEKRRESRSSLLEQREVGTVCVCVSEK